MNNFPTKLMLLTVVWLAVGGIAWHAGESLAQQAPPTAKVQWRRTVNGWERADLWTVGNLSPEAESNRAFTTTAPLPPPQVHPVAVAGFLMGVAALMAVGAGNSARHVA